MKKVELWVKTTMVGSKVNDIIEFEDDITEKELEEYLKDWIFENIDFNFKILD
jgi:hypothetical protein